MDKEKMILALHRIPDEGAINKAKRRAIIIQINKQKEKKK